MKKKYHNILGSTRDACILSSMSFLSKHSGRRVDTLFSHIHIYIISFISAFTFFASSFAREIPSYTGCPILAERALDIRYRAKRGREKKRTLTFNDPVSPIPFGHFVYGGVLESLASSLRVFLSLSLVLSRFKRSRAAFAAVQITNNDRGRNPESNARASRSDIYFLAGRGD